MDSFPDDIISNILARIPTVGLTRLQYVCKRWRSIIKGPLFRRLHLQWSYSMSNPMDNQFLMVESFHKLSFQNLTDKTISFETRLFNNRTGIWDEIVRTHNGLLVFCSRALGSIFIMNPFTNQQKLLPKVDGNWSSGALQACGFAFDPTNNSYKVVIIARESSAVSKYSRSNHHRIMLFDNRSTKWRRVGLTNYVIWDKSQVLVNGRLHWLANDKIISFDLANEKLSLIAPPHRLMQTFRSLFVSCSLMVFGGYLCVVTHLYRYETLDLQIWVMKEYGVENSWVKEFDMKCAVPSELRACGKYTEVVGEIENCKILVRCDADSDTDSFVLLCEPRCQRYEFFGIKEVPILFGGRRTRSFIHTINLNWVTP